MPGARPARTAAEPHRGQVLLREALALPALLDDLAHLQGHTVMVQLLCLAVQLGCVLAD